MARPAFAPEQEVRFAVVMYGGVSLAIYINGVVQELFRMVRATAPEFQTAEGPYGQDAYFHTEKLCGTERVYRTAGQALGRDGKCSRPKADSPIRTRFVVDILSGSSAGGINAIFLAKAIAKQHPIAPLRKLWLGEADIGQLVNDKASYKDVDGLKRRKPPRSLLNSGRLYVRALEALKEMELTEDRNEDDFSPAYAEELDLAVTTTDLHGISLPIQLHDQVVWESRHRNVLRFVYASDKSSGTERNDFGEENDTLLAFAARCTSAFPFAFEPAVAEDMPQPLAAGSTDLRKWNEFFPDYMAQKCEWATYPFADGGYLDNKPFSHATERLRVRRADFPVKRKLLYIEPDPTGDPAPPGTPPPIATKLDEVPDAVETVIEAVTLPRVETIRDDIQAVIDRNRTVERIRRLTAELRESITSGPDPLLGCPQLWYTPYLLLRVEMVVDDLASTYVRLAGGRDDSDEVEAARVLIRRYVAEEYEGDKRRFLARYDLRFRLRRIAFAQDAVTELWDKHPEQREELARIKARLNEALIQLRRRGRMARRRPVTAEADARRAPADAESEAERVEAEQVERLTLVAGSVRMDAQRVKEVLGAGSAEEPWVPQGFDAVIEELLDVLDKHLRPAFHEADVVLRDYLRERNDEVAKLYERFESFDMVMLPLTYPGLEEVNPVEVFRIAPEDAVGLISEGRPGEERRKLAGTAIGHFGGFMDETWRRNDLMWGRLDGAERILTCLLPKGELRDELLQKAFYEIIREELLVDDAGPLTDLLAGALGDDGAASAGLLAALRDETTPADRRAEFLAGLREVEPEKLLKQFGTRYEVPRRLDPQATTSVAGRAVDVSGKVLREVSTRRSVPTKPAFWLSRMGLLVWGLAEVAVPGRKGMRWPGILFRNWTTVALILAVILIVLGALVVDDIAQAGWILLIGALVLRVLVWVVGAVMTEPPAAFASRDPPARTRRRLSWLAVPVAVGLVAAAIVLDDDGWSWLLAAAGIAVLVAGWILAAPHQRRLWAAAAAAGLAVFALAAIEIGHIDEDADAAATWLWGDSESGLEGAVRDGWDAIWPWSDGDGAAEQGANGGDGDGDGGGGGGGGDTIVVVPPGSDDLGELRDAIDRLREEQRNQVPARLLSNILAGVPGAIGAFSAWLETTRGLTADLAGVALRVLGRVGVRASFSPTLNVDGPAFSLGGVNLGFSPNFALGGIRVNVERDGKQPQPEPNPTKVRPGIERFYADQTFGVGESTLTEAARQRLVFLRERIARGPGSVRGIAIHGYADMLGGGRDNDRLARKRIRAVRNVLLSGLPKLGDRVREVPHGEARKIAVAESDRWRAYDRRAEVVIVTVR